MPSFIIKLEKFYLIWSTVVDAPITDGMSLKELKEWIKFNYGKKGLDNLPARLKRVEKRGTSAHYTYCNSISELISHNRAGDNEENLTPKQIIEKYCIKEVDTK